jgi:hypothetical protein
VLRENTQASVLGCDGGTIVGDRTRLQWRGHVFRIDARSKCDLEGNPLAAEGSKLFVWRVGVAKCENCSARSDVNQMESIKKEKVIGERVKSWGKVDACLAFRADKRDTPATTRE